MTEKLRPISQNDKALDQAVSILIPYVEGYPIVALPLSQKPDSTSELLTTIIWKCLKQSL
jgi:hypothetical protein